MNACAVTPWTARCLAITLVMLAWLSSPPAYAHSAHDAEGSWLVRAELVTSHSLDVETDAGQLGGDYYAPDTLSPSLSLTRFITPSWAIQFSGGVSTTSVHLNDTFAGDIDAGDVTTAAVMASLQYYWPTMLSLQPYLGAGIVYAWPLDVSPSDGLQPFDVKTLVIPALQLGLDYRVDMTWSAGLSATYLFVPAQRYSGEGFNVEVDLDQLTLGAGIGYRF